MIRKIRSFGARELGSQVALRLIPWVFALALANGPSSMPALTARTRAITWMGGRVLRVASAQVRDTPRVGGCGASGPAYERGHRTSKIICLSAKLAWLQLAAASALRLPSRLPGTRRPGPWRRCYVSPADPAASRSACSMSASCSSSWGRSCFAVSQRLSRSRRWYSCTTTLR